MDKKYATAYSDATRGQKGNGKGKKGKGKGKGKRLGKSPLSLEGRKAKLKELKGRTFSSVCGQKGHWQSDPECPKTRELGARMATASGHFQRNQRYECAVIGIGDYPDGDESPSGIMAVKYEHPVELPRGDKMFKIGAHQSRTCSEVHQDYLEYYHWAMAEFFKKGTKFLEKCVQWHGECFGVDLKTQTTRATIESVKVKQEA
jgi:hypothetical protein